MAGWPPSLCLICGMVGRQWGSTGQRRPAVLRTAAGRAGALSVSLGSTFTLVKLGSMQSWLLSRKHLMLSGSRCGSATSGGHRENPEVESSSPSPVLGTGAPACAASSSGVSLQQCCCPRAWLLDSVCFGLTCSASTVSSAEMGDFSGRSCHFFPARWAKAQFTPSSRECS